MSTSGLPKNRQYKQLLIPPEQDYQAFVELQEIKKGIVGFVEDGHNLYICSKNFGNGKTSWAVKLLQQYFNEIWAGNGFRVRGIFVNVPTFLFKIRDGISNSDHEFETLRARIVGVDVVIWDDIAATKLSDYDHANLLTYIDQRIFAGKANIYTGNLVDNSIFTALGNRLASRVYNESRRIELVGIDKRGAR
ncbi:hypothetical protein [Bacteroides sp.]|uniref:hypothetical protein n=1 Tax=Bacteroides sp. TaxID=29523 RepID=UPI00262AEB90|nr:hypothetical protein [Bacteroides sp.]MDD3039731.1 hypothetical protein [Bacteroides sp.]